MAMPVRGMSSRAAQAERTRQQILETAQRLFTDLGYDATSLQMIADEMGLTKAAVYYHFRAKSDILHAAMQPGIQRLEALLDESAAIRGRRARIEHLVDGFVDFLVQHRLYASMTAADPAAKRNDLDSTKDTLARRALTLFYGDNPNGAERLSFGLLFFIPQLLPELTDLTDEELRQALQITILRMLRIPQGALRLASDSAPGGDLARAENPWLWPPLLGLDHAGFEQVKSGEEARDRIPVTHGCLRSAHPLVHAPGHLRHLRGPDIAGWVREHQVAAGRHRRHEPGHDAVRIVCVRDQVQDDQQHERDRLAEVQGRRRGLHDGLGVAQIGIEVRRRAFAGTGEKGPGV
jgi:AcrR family transcriptional regulator